MTDTNIPTNVYYNSIGETAQPAHEHNGRCDSDTSRGLEQLFSFLFVRRFWIIVKVLLGRCKRVAIPMIMLLLTTLFIQEFVIYFIGQVPSKFYKVLLERDYSGFISVVFESLLIVSTVAFANSAKEYMKNCVSVVWREELTWQLQEKYFSNCNYYYVNGHGTSMMEDSESLEQSQQAGRKKVENVDQRMTSDVNSLCSSLAGVLAECIIVPFLVAYYSVKAASVGWIAPVACFCFFLVFAAISIVTIIFVAPRVYAVDRFEGDFRFAHAHTRKFAEPIAFVDGGQAEHLAAENRFHLLIHEQRRLFVRQFGLQCTNEFASYLASILSYILVGIAVFSGTYDGVSSTDLSVIISQMSFAIMYLINCFTRVIQTGVQVATVVGNTHRIGELLEQLKLLEKSAGSRGWLLSNDPAGTIEPNNDLVMQHLPAHSQDNGYVTEQSEKKPNQTVDSSPLHGTFMACRDLDIAIPGRSDALHKGFSFSVSRSKNLLIFGPSGCGKSSLFRVLRGLWSPLAGHVDRFVQLVPSSAAFVTQVPYFMLDASLRQLILYPTSLTTQRNSTTLARRSPTVGVADTLLANSSSVKDEELIERLIDYCELKKTVQRIGGLDTRLPDASAVLSPGEQQRLVFCRLFYHRPAVVFLDEATCHVGTDMEAKLYSMCSQLAITYVSIGHRESLRKLHTLFIPL